MVKQQTLKTIDTEKRKTLAMAMAAFCVPTASVGDTQSMHDQVKDHVLSLIGDAKPTLRILIPEGSEHNLKPVIDAFFQATGVMVQTESVGVDDINTTITLDALTNQAQYDLALPATFGLPDLVDANSIRPLDDFVEKYEPKGYRDELLFNVGDRFDGQTFGFQTDGDAYVMFYNTDFLRDPKAQDSYANQFDRPLDIPTTWEELDQQIAFFHKPLQGKYGGALFRTPNYVAWEWWVRFHAKGVWPLDENMIPQIHSSEGVEALEEMIEVSQNLVDGADRFGLFENWRRFAKGDIFCNIGWGGSQKYFNAPTSPIRGKLAYGPTPGGMVDGQLLSAPYFNWGWDYVVTQTSRNPELSYLFALFASTPHISTLAVRQRNGFFDPFREEHYQDAGIQAAYSQDFLNVHRTSLKMSMPDLYLKNKGAYFSELSAKISLALAGELSANTALELAAQRWHAITARAGASEQIRRWEALRQKYPPEIRMHLRHANQI